MYNKKGLFFPVEFPGEIDHNLTSIKPNVAITGGSNQYYNEATVQTRGNPVLKKETKQMIEIISTVPQGDPYRKAAHQPSEDLP